MTDLFRPQALEGHRQSWLGSIQLIRPPSFALLTSLVLIVALVVIAFLVLGEYTRKARVSGHLVPKQGVVRLVAPQAAMVLENHAVEGRSVRQGEVLFVLAIEPSVLAREQQQLVADSLAARERVLLQATLQQRQLDASRSQSLDRQIVQMRSELQQMAAQAGLQEQRLRLAEQSQLRLESLRDGNFVSTAQLQTKAEEVLALRAEIIGLHRLRSTREREIGELEARRRELPLQSRNAQGDIERDRAALQQQQAETEATRRIVLRAPQDGTVSGVLAALGQSVGEGTPLASLLPADTRLEAHLFAPSSAIGFVRPEQPVLLRYQAFPYQKFGHQTGKVVQVSRTPLPAGEALGLTRPASEAREVEPRYRITVALERQTVSAHGEAYALAPGMQLDADVQLDRRRLVEWLFEPLLGMAGRL